MPSSTVYSGLGSRAIEPHKANPAQVYGIATWLGVGYSTLSNHLCYSMEIVSKQHLRHLLRHEPKEIKSELVREETTKDVFQLDHLWDGGCAHGQVGDFFVGITTCSGSLLARVREGLFVANEPGQASVTLNGGGRVEIKIARENYIGFYEYRYLREET